MANWKEPIDTIRKRLLDSIIFSNIGNNVSQLDLDLLNRAQMWLEQYRQWDFLTREIAITLDANRSYTLPEDLNSVLEVYSSLEASGKPTHHYYNNSADVENRYVLSSEFDKATGHVWKIVFAGETPIQGELILKYTYSLPDFSGSGTEYSFFPPNLLLRCAQKLHIEDKGITGDSPQLILSSFAEELRKFESNSQYSNQPMDLTVKNKYGVPLKIHGSDLNGQGTGSHYRPYLPSTFMSGY
jgi:hypothetical protein